MALPQTVLEYLVTISTQNRSLAYLHITPDGDLLGWGGSLSKYGLKDLKIGSNASDYLFYLEGFFPLEQTNDILPALHTEQGLIFDIHLIADPQEGWVLLLDTTKETEQQQKLQQKGNDLSLLRQQYAKLLNQCLTQQQQTELITGQLPVSQREVSVLLVKVCNLTDDSHQLPPTSTLKALNAFVSVMIQIIVEEGGVINHILAETAVAFFGLLPSLQSSAQLAVYAAKRIIQKFQVLPPAADVSQLGIGMGVTSGNAATGIIHSQGYQTLNAIGPHIQRATQLASRIAPDTILLDQATFKALDDQQAELCNPIQANPLYGPELYRLTLER